VKHGVFKLSETKTPVSRKKFVDFFTREAQKVWREVFYINQSLVDILSVSGADLARIGNTT
jgi:hypothetical protein